MQFTVLSQAAEARSVEWRGEGVNVSWKPFAGPQTWAYNCQADEIGYGGAGGGGKTDLGIGLALTKHLRATFFRRTYVQLSAAQDRATEILTGTSGARFNEQKRTWRLRGVAGRQNRRFRFGAMEHEKDKENWRGNDDDLKVFDEAQNFSRSQVMFAKAWIRTAQPGQKCTLLLNFNPPTTVEGQWIIDYFDPWLNLKNPNPARPGEIRYFITNDEGEDTEVPGPEMVMVAGQWVRPRSRTFFPASTKDNPVYMATGYWDSLMALPEPLRSQMAFGNFQIGIQDDAWQLIPTAWIQAAMDRHKLGRPMVDGKPMPLTALGGDIACGGKNRTVLAPIYGSWYGPLQVHPGTATPDGESAAALIITALGDSKVKPNIDIIGVGQGARTALKMAGVPFNEINVAEGSHSYDRTGRLKFVNLRAEIYWRFREALDPENQDGIKIALPDDKRLLRELAAHHWELTHQGIKIEKKEDVVETLKGDSPDLAEAVVLAWYQAQGAKWGKNPWGKS